MKNSKCSGFALVIALSLMAFILLLLLSITTLVRVETSSAANSRAQLLARQNAKLAAMHALGRLQQLAGPDQRVTARAEILYPPVAGTADLTVTGGVEGQTMWTGVWSSKAATDDANDAVVGLDLERSQWLVSGIDPDARVAEVDTIELVSAASGTSAAQRVVVPLETLSKNGSDEVGEFAYWVSDEGVKARINSGNPHFASNGDDTEVGYYNGAMAQVFDPAASSDYFTDPSSPTRYFDATPSLWKSNNSLSSRIATFSDLGLVNTSVTEAGLKAHFHDFTTTSNALLVNTKEGGIKTDLSTVLSDPATYGLTGPMFLPASGGDPVEGDPGGPLWEQLADYYGYCVDSGRDLPPVKHANDRVNFAPILTRFQYEVHGFAMQKAGNGGDPTIDSNRADFFEYSMGIFPVATLWNPYDREMPIPELQLMVECRPMQIIDTANGNAKVMDLLSTSDMVRVNDERRWTLCFTIGPSDAVKTLQPGEALNFVAPHHSWLATRANQAANEANYLKPGGFIGGQLWGFYTSPMRDLTLTDKSRLDFRFNQGTGQPQWKLVAGLYDIEDKPRHNATSYTEETRVASFTFGGNGQFQVTNSTQLPGFDKTGQYHHPVDDSNRFRFDTHIDVIGSSETYEPQPDTEFSHINRTALKEYKSFGSESASIDGRTWGHAFAMAFPQSELNTENTKARRPHLYTQFNPRSPSFGLHAAIFDPNNEFLYNPLNVGPVDLWSADAEKIYDAEAVSEMKAYVGLSNSPLTFDDNDGRAILYEYPIEPPLSIGQLSQANLINVDAISDSLDIGWFANKQQPHTTPAYAIGNSFANVHLDLDEVSKVITNADFDGQTPSTYAGAHYDYSYLLNDLLWDGYFFSSILPDNTSPGSGDLPNSRMKIWGDATDEELLNASRAASKMAVEGGFNINSTSIAAWEAVLGAMRDVEVLPNVAGDDNSSEGADLLHNYSRFTRPAVTSTSQVPSYGNDDISMSMGYRSLTDAQISSLAQEIVKEIRTRRSEQGIPFRSLSEFINRSIDLDANNPRFAYCGPLQHAIDQSAVNGKPALDEEWQRQSDGDGLWDDFQITPELTGPTGALDADSLDVINGRPYAEGLPGALMQSDLLSKLGSALTARSDTFTIRAYGNVKDPVSDGTMAEAYCDMVVQRIPEYVDSAESGSATGDASFDAPSSAVNLQFGRRFRVVSFRFLNKDEI
ncbi:MULTISPECIES: hypothetical protein [unclassified Lentimonas]|uniref:hypothetical protein n=1 Tax=unclassified Lentimonas TaxID=2630993 RepID=UPI001321357F|nr:MULTISPECIES: hypothetical protein [unclassified Lentimonas]CAA6679670.1 Unannotated [Lentimonas sp. CC4]CAA6683563.1 Unannotated [Lentimonas sp. CC6]CAA7077325.1 Unannotated [Lentimonas sp. CC4]CAA7170160.1 Unannotated [Lentimonas sp. CC21]CAA7182453.1 Unannotated [Lentimonas sp. CC8]